MQEIIAENLGPIELFSFQPAHKGVTVFKGPNGVGKSILQRAIQDAASGTGKLPLRDHTKRGKFEGFGATITIGGKCRHTGEFEVQHIEGRFDISQLIDPGLKTPSAADAARIKALVSLTGVKADPVLFQRHEAFTDFDKIVKAESVKTDDLVEMARRIKADYDEAARSASDEAEREDGHANALATHDDLDLSKEDDPQILQHEYDKARDISSRLQERKQNYDDREKADQKTRETIKELRESSTGKELEQLEERKKGLERDLANLNKEHEDRCAKSKSSDPELRVISAARTQYLKEYPEILGTIGDAWKKLNAIKETRGTLSGPVITIGELLENMEDTFRSDINFLDEAIKQFQKDCDDNFQRITFLEKQIVEATQKQSDIDYQLESINVNRQKLEMLEESLRRPSEAPPTDEEIEAAQRAVIAASESQEQGSLIRQAKKDIEKAKEHRSKAAKARDRADRYRHAGKSTDEVLSESIESGSLRIESDGKSARLVTDTERGKGIPYHDLSDGQRAKIAIDIGAECVGKEGLLVVDQQIWEGLDGDNRILIHNHAKELDLYIFTFESTKEPGAPREITPVPFGGEE